MGIRTILVLLNGESDDSHVLDCAWSLAERHAAHVVCVRFGPAAPDEPDAAVLPPEAASSAAERHLEAWFGQRMPHTTVVPGAAPRASLDPALVIDGNPHSVIAR